MTYTLYNGPAGPAGTSRLVDTARPEEVINCARIELVVALHSLASQFENETAAFTGDDLTAVQGHIRHARKIAAKHNQNGPGCTPPTLPPNYIDPEHQGEDRELLQIFYRAAFGEGGTADEITLRGIKAVLAARSAPLEDVSGSITDGQREAVRAAVAEALGDTYDCTRVWEAWGVGTMGPDDFVLVADDGDRVAEIADAAIEALCPAAPSPPEDGETGELAAWLTMLRSNSTGIATRYDERLARVATLLQQQEARIASLRSALAESGRAVGSLISDDCSDSFLLEVPAEVRLAVAKPAPAAVPVAWCRSDEFLNSMSRGGSFNGWKDPGAIANKCDMQLYAIQLPQAGEVEV